LRKRFLKFTVLIRKTKTNGSKSLKTSTVLGCVDCINLKAILMPFHWILSSFLINHPYSSTDRTSMKNTKNAAKPFTFQKLPRKTNSWKFGKNAFGILKIVLWKFLKWHQQFFNLSGFLHKYRQNNSENVCQMFLYSMFD
jgi:hypothetical protein